MAKITVGNSYSRIEGLTPAQEKLLRNELSYTVGGQNAYFSKYGPRKKSLLSKHCEFPTGLLHRLAKLINVGDSVVDSRVVPKMKPSLAPQSKLVAYLAQQEALFKALKSHRGTICMPTGTGKSYVIALIAANLGVKTLVIVPSIEIKRQLQESVASLGIITVENIDNPKLAQMTDFDCLIIDEAHHVAAKTYQKLNKTAWAGIYYRFFLTATPFRNDSEETLLFESIAGQVIYRLSYKKAIENNYIVPVESYFIEIPKQQTDAYTYRQVYDQLVVNNTPRNTTISNLLTSLHGGRKSTLCLVREVEHGKILADITGLPFVNGADEQSRRYIKQFNNGEIKVLIGTTGILGEGIDTKPCEYVVIAGLGKAKSQFMQQVGRSVRKYPGKESAKVILIKDKSHKFLSRHFKSQCDILLEEYGSKTLKLDVGSG